MTLNPRHKEIQPGNPADTSLSLQVVFLCWLSRAQQHLPLAIPTPSFESYPRHKLHNHDNQLRPAVLLRHVALLVLIRKGRQHRLGTGPTMAPVLTGRSLHFYPQMGIARPQTLALALSLGRLSASSNLCPRHETFDYCNLFLPHPVLSVGITSIHKGSTCARAIASKQTHSTSRVEFQHRLHQLSYPRKQQQQPFQRCICIPLQLDYRS